MPGIPHEAPLELLRRNPILAAALLAGAGLSVPDGKSAVLASGDVSSALPTELRADAVVVLGGPAGKLVVVVEVQTVPDQDKRWVWPAYVVQARLQHRCPAVLLIICRDRVTGRWARRPISCGHPGFELAPIVIDAQSTPLPGQSGVQAASAELAVLAAFTGAVDLEQESGRRTVLGAIATAGLGREQLGTYTQLVSASASAVARKALEAMMTTEYKNEFLEQFFAEGEAEGRAKGKAAGRVEGEAEGEARMLLRMLAALGFDVPADTQARVLACTDLGQLRSWADRVTKDAGLDEIFAS